MFRPIYFVNELAHINNKLRYLALLILFMWGCDKKKEETHSTEIKKYTIVENLISDSLVKIDFNGEYVCEFGPLENGYLAYILTLNQTKDSLVGKLFAGTYMNNSEIGYTILANSIETSLKGRMNGKEIFFEWNSAIDSTISDREFALPTFKEILNTDSHNNNLLWIEKNSNGIHTIIHGDTIAFRKRN